MGFPSFLMPNEHNTNSSKPPIRQSLSRRTSFGPGLLPRIVTRIKSIPNEQACIPETLESEQSSIRNRILPESFRRSSPSPSSSVANRRASLDGNFKMPLSVREGKSVKKVGLLRVLHQLKSEEDLSLTDIEFERKIMMESASANDVIDDEMIISPGVVIQPSKLNPEHEFSPRLRDEMRLISPSPIHNSIPSPITQKRKLSSAGLEERYIEAHRIAKPMKRIRRAANIPFSVHHHGHVRNHSGSSVASDISMVATGLATSDCGMDSPRVSAGQGLNLGGTGTEFSKMKLS